MKITETIERECCSPQDLKPVQLSPQVRGSIPEQKFCVHCGARHFYKEFIDEDGGRSSEYRKELPTRQQSTLK